MVVIHNYANEADKESYASYLASQGIRHVLRPNKGMDIGALQDVFMERLEGFDNDWDYLLWCTDDCLPMDKNFVKRFHDHIVQQGVGVSCMELSQEVREHIRTTGFMISKEVSKKIEFPTDPIISKHDCYMFEHLSKDKTFLDSIKRQGLMVRQIGRIEDSVMWDSGQKKRQHRKPQHYKAFPLPSQSSNKVAVVSLIYNQFPEIISTMLLQTHKDWELILIHDGPNSTNLGQFVKAINDPRITYIETKERLEKWGHPHRQWALQELGKGALSPNAEFVCITNADNYYAPTYLEYMLRGFSENIVGTYCSQMVHSYIGHGVINCRLEQGYVDCAGVMLRKNIACEIGWNHPDAHSSDWLFFNDVIKKYTREAFVKVNGCLLVHN